ncbi:MAG: EDSAP-1 family PEP-CTERM protein [Pseudomonadota bacterium]
MKPTKLFRLLPAAVALAGLGLGGTGAAQAGSVYGVSHLEVDNLSIAITGSPAPNNFNFTATNTAILNGVPTITSATCSGFPSTCAAAPPRLDPLPAQIPAATRANNAFPNIGGFLGPGASEYSTSDSVIYTAQLTGDAVTHTQQIAESELQGGTSASASAQIQSITGFTFTFTLLSPGSLTLSFDADPDMMAAISALGINGAQASMQTSFDLSQNTGGSGFARWTPQGTAADDCAEGGGVTCTEAVGGDPLDLNLTIGTTSNGTSITHSLEAAKTLAGLYSITASGLTAGDWTLTLSAVTSTNLTHVPEPATLLLLGAGLAAFGVGGARRQKRHAV